MTALVALLVYTTEKMVDKALIAIQPTGLFSQVVLKRKKLLLENDTWSEMKAHFCEAYKEYPATGAGTSDQHGYTKNATEANNDSSLNTILNDLLP